MNKREWGVGMKKSESERDKREWSRSNNLKRAIMWVRDTTQPQFWQIVHELFELDLAHTKGEITCKNIFYLEAEIFFCRKKCWLYSFHCVVLDFNLYSKCFVIKSKVCYRLNSQKCASSFFEFHIKCVCRKILRRIWIGVP